MLVKYQWMVIKMLVTVFPGRYLEPSQTSKLFYEN